MLLNSNLISAIIWWFLWSIIWPVIKYFFDYQLEKRKMKLYIKNEDLILLKKNIFELITTLHQDRYQFVNCQKTIEISLKTKKMKKLKNIELSETNTNIFWIVSMYIPEISNIYIKYYSSINEIKNMFKSLSEHQDDIETAFIPCEKCKKKKKCWSYKKKDGILNWCEELYKKLNEVIEETIPLTDLIIKWLMIYYNDKNKF